MRYANTDNGRVHGAELGMTLTLPAGFSLSDDFTLMDAENTDTDRRLLFSPQLFNIARLEWRTRDTGTLASLRAVTTGNWKLTETEKAGGHTMWNLYFSQRIVRGVKFYAGADNIFNKRVLLQGSEKGPTNRGTFFFTGLSYATW